MAMKVLTTGVSNPEGPISLPDGSWIFTEMDIGCITLLKKDGERQHITKTPLPNGLALGKDGRIWAADADEPALFVVTMEGNTIKFSSGSEENPFLLPNDLCFGPDGMLYMTCSGIHRSEFKKTSSPLDAYDLHFDGKLFKIDPVSGECEVLDRGFRLTNGIAFGPGGEYLYVAETLSGNIFRYKYGVWQREYFGSVMLKPPREYGRVAGPDGMAFDCEGNLYVAVIAQDITVLDSSGKMTDHIILPGKNPTNLAFDSGGGNFLMVTEAERNELLIVETDLPGLPLYQD